MNNINKTKSDQRNILNSMDLKNKRYFKNYFIQTWCKSNLSHDLYKFIKELNTTDVAFKNKKVVNFIYGKYKISTTELNIKDELKKSINDELLRIVNQNTNYYDISLGDVIFVINSVGDKYIDTETQAFVFAIKTMYTFFLEEYINDWKLDICSYISSIVERKENKVLSKDSPYSDKEDIIQNIILKYPNYLILVGVGFYNANEYNRVVSINKSNRECLYKDIKISNRSIGNTIKSIVNLSKFPSNKSKRKQLGALEIFLILFQKQSKIKYRQIEDVLAKNVFMFNDQLNVFSLFSNVLNYILSIIIHETEEDSDNYLVSLYGIIKEISKEERTIFSTIYKMIYKGITESDINDTILDSINKNNYKRFRNNIYQIIDEFSFNNIEVLEYSILNSKADNTDFLEKGILEFVKGVLLKKFNIENGNSTVKEKCYNSFIETYLQNKSKNHNLENRLKYNYVTPYDTEIEEKDRKIIIRSKDTGLFKAVYYDFNESLFLHKNKFYDIYLECLSDKIDTTESVSISDFYDIDLEGLYEEIQNKIDKNKK